MRGNAARGRDRRRCLRHRAHRRLVRAGPGHHRHLAVAVRGSGLGAGGLAEAADRGHRPAGPGDRPVGRPVGAPGLLALAPAGWLRPRDDLRWSAAVADRAAARGDLAGRPGSVSRPSCATGCAPLRRNGVAFAVAALSAAFVGPGAGLRASGTRPTGRHDAGGSNWSDLGVHLSIAQSLNAGNFPPQVPYFAGCPAGLPLVCRLPRGDRGEAAGLFADPGLRGLVRHPGRGAGAAGPRAGAARSCAAGARDGRPSLAAAAGRLRRRAGLDATGRRPGRRSLATRSR